MGRGGILTISGPRTVAYSARLHSGLQPKSDIGRSLGEAEGEQIPIHRPALRTAVAKGLALDELEREVTEAPADKVGGNHHSTRRRNSNRHISARRLERC